MKSGAAPHQDGRWAEVFAPRKSGEKRYWLVKSEPDVFSFDDLLRAPKKTTCWDGIRNYAARNFLRDGMKRGDLVFFYHSQANPPGIVGICEVVREGYPDANALDKKHPQFDQKGSAENPAWFAVDLRAVARLKNSVTLPDLKKRRELADMALLRIGRLSVTPVSRKEWDAINEMAESAR